MPSSANSGMEKLSVLRVSLGMAPGPLLPARVKAYTMAARRHSLAVTRPFSASRRDSREPSHGQTLKTAAGRRLSQTHQDHERSRLVRVHLWGCMRNCTGLHAAGEVLRQ
jgi:hypothetical protein